VADVNPDEAAALAFVQHAKRMMDTLQPMLPDGTHFGVFILVPGEREGRVVAVTTDRDVVCPAVAQWVLNTLREAREDPT
jgi:hypothetical protein